MKFFAQFLGRSIKQISEGIIEDFKKEMFEKTEQSMKEFLFESLKQFIK